VTGWWGGAVEGDGEAEPPSGESRRRFGVGWAQRVRPKKCGGKGRICDTGGGESVVFRSIGGGFFLYLGGSGPRSLGWYDGDTCRVVS
jgi:hypothetical protein